MGIPIDMLPINSGELRPRKGLTDSVVDYSKFSAISAFLYHFCSVYLKKHCDVWPTK